MNSVSSWRSPSINLFCYITMYPAKALAITLQIVSASSSVHMLELRSESFLSIKKALLKKGAQHDYQDVLGKTFSISEGTSIYYKDDVVDRAPISRLVLAMVPEKNFTGDYKTNPFHFHDFELRSYALGCTCGSNANWCELQSYPSLFHNNESS